MAKHTAKSRKSRLHVPKIVSSVTLATLADADVVSNAMADTVVSDEFLISTECVYSIRGATPGEGPIIFGWAHSDYAAAEIEEALEAQGAWDTGDLVLVEQARRKVRIIGQFPVTVAAEAFREGQPIRTSMKFMLTEGDSLALWAWNQSGATLTTGAVIEAQGKAFLRK